MPIHAPLHSLPTVMWETRDVAGVRQHVAEAYGGRAIVREYTSGVCTWRVRRGGTLASGFGSVEDCKRRAAYSLGLVALEQGSKV